MLFTVLRGGLKRRPQEEPRSAPRRKRPAFSGVAADPSRL